MIKKVYLSLLFCGLFFQGWSTHIVGGDFTYRWISGNTFELSLTLFRDCNGAALFDPEITIGVFDRVTDQLTDTLTMQLISTGSLQLAGSQCSPPPEICVESGIYIKNIVLPNNPNGYYLSWERCCRNHTVVNIDNPGATGMVFYMELPDPALHNSSPYFLNDPLPYMCENQPFEYNFGGMDPDGDSLSFELIIPSSGNSSQSFPILPSPVAGPYSNALFTPGYTLSNVCGGSGPLTIDPVTGDITAVTNFVGIYAMAELVREYRNGVQIGMIRREIEVTVIICDDNSTPEIKSMGFGFPVGKKNFEIYESDSLCFSIDGNDITDSLFISYSGDCFPGSGINPPFAVTQNASGFKHVTTDFCWHTACGQGKSTPYKVKFEVKDNGCPLPITVKYDISILVKPTPLITPPDLLCISFEDDHSIRIHWTDTADDNRFLMYYLLYRNINGGAFTILDTLFNKKAGGYTDHTAFEMDKYNYCYYLTALNSCAVSGNFSNILCSDDAKNEKENYIEYVSVTGHNQVELKLENFAGINTSTFYIFRRENDTISGFQPYVTFTGLPEHSWKDLGVKTNEKSYCYYLINEDACHNTSPPSKEACTILLKGHSVPYINTINWSEYINWKGGVFDYEIYRKMERTVEFSKLTNVEYLVFDLEDRALDYDFGRYIYQVKGIEGDGGNQAVSYSNEVELDQPPYVFVPNAFTPNSDNANEEWGVSSVFIRDFTLRIFNRYGQLVYHSNNKHESWDGTFHGQAAPQGVYIYDLRYNSYYEEAESRKTGTITLLK